MSDNMEEMLKKLEMEEQARLSAILSKVDGILSELEEPFRTDSVGSKARVVRTQLEVAKTAIRNK